MVKLTGKKKKRTKQKIMPENPTENLENLSAIELLHKAQPFLDNGCHCNLKTCKLPKLLYDELEQRIIELEFNANEPCACLITEQKETDNLTNFFIGASIDNSNIIDD